MNPAFRDFSGLTTKDVEVMRLTSAQCALSEATRASLVKASKSPTIEKPPVPARDLSIFEPIVELESLAPVFEKECSGPGRFTVIQHRAWSDEYRIRTRVETSKIVPSAPDGPRSTLNLSERGKRKLTESCYYMAKCKGGYKTFITGTFAPEARERIASGATTIQREVSRTMDAMQKMYQRGWTDSKGNRHAGQDEPLGYCWVVEIPENDDGEENPHVHFLMNWRVKRQHFDDWAARIEGLWGHGYFHLEKMRKPEAAGEYLAKAAGYLSKATGQSDQGKVRGNRYGISSTARAPSWVTITEAELGVMGKLITDMHERATDKWGPLYQEKAKLKKQLEATPKCEKERRHMLGAQLEKARQLIAKIPVVAGKYQTILKGSEAFWKFMGHAAGAGWDAAHRPCSMWLHKFGEQLRANRAINRQRYSDSEWIQAVNDYTHWLSRPDPDDALADWDHYAATVH